jgi:hypothetical protein
MRRVPLPPSMRLRGWGKRMPSPTAVLDITCEEVDIHTHGIIHLEYYMEVQDAELEERAEMIVDLEQQLLEL